MAGIDNLRVPTSDEARKNGSKGGKASGEARRRRKTMKETLEILLDMPLKGGKASDIESIRNFAMLKGKNITVEQALLIAQIQKGLKGDTTAFQVIRDTSGQKPVDETNVKVSGDVNNPFEGLTTEELKKMISDG